MKHPISSFFTRSAWAPLAAVVWNVLVAFVAYGACRLIFVAENWSYFAPTMTGSHLLHLLRGGVWFDASAIAYTLSLWLVLMLLPLHAKERPAYHRALKWLYVAVMGIAVAMNLADCVYFQYTSRRTTSTIVSEFSHEGNLMGVVGTELLRHWYLVLAAVVIVGGLWLLYRMPRLERRRLGALRFGLVQLLALVLVAPAVVGGMRGGLAHSVRPITVSNANQWASRPAEAAIVLNTPFSLLRTLGKNVFTPPQYFNSQASLEAVYTPLHTPAPSQALQRKNVVVLIVESFGQEYMGFGNPWQGYTPFADSLASHSMTWELTLANGRKSIDAMPSTLSSIPMMVEPFFLTPASMNDLSGVARLLGAEGYQSAFFHGAPNGSMGFQAFAQSTGYGSYYGKDDYEADPKNAGRDDFDGMWAIWDEPFLQWMSGKLDQMRQPFVASVFTASSHHPFKVPKELESQYPEEGGMPMHKCIRYTDNALRRFFQAASRQSWYRNTIFVLVADHTNMSNHDQYKTDLGLYRIPILFYAPDGSIAPGVRPGVAQQADVLPTLLHLLGYGKPYVAFGQDLLSTPAPQQWAYSYNNGTHQLVQDKWLMQFDGQRVTALYDFKADPLLRRNLVAQAPQHQAMQQLLKAIIQQYMTRMSGNQLVVR